MSESPKNHVFLPEAGDHDRCCDCGHHISASWHYVKGSDHLKLREQVEAAFREAFHEGYICDPTLAYTDEDLAHVWGRSTAKARLEGR